MSANKLVFSNITHIELPLASAKEIYANNSTTITNEISEQRNFEKNNKNNECSGRVYSTT